MLSSLADMAGLLDWELESQVLPTVRWLVQHRRAKIVDIVHAGLKTVFTLPPKFDQPSVPPHWSSSDLKNNKKPAGYPNSPPNSRVNFRTHLSPLSLRSSPRSLPQSQSRAITISLPPWFNPRNLFQCITMWCFGC